MLAPHELPPGLSESLPFLLRVEQPPQCLPESSGVQRLGQEAGLLVADDTRHPFAPERDHWKAAGLGFEVDDADRLSEAGKGRSEERRVGKECRPRGAR